MPYCKQHNGYYDSLDGCIPCRADSLMASSSKTIKEIIGEPEMIDAPTIAGTFPVVLYLCSEEDREELIQALMVIHPNMKSRKL